MDNVNFIDEVNIVNKKVLLRVDFNVPISNGSVTNGIKIQQSLPTLKFLLANKNRLIIISHLKNPENRTVEYSLAPVIKKLQKYLPEYKIDLVNDFTNADKNIFEKQTNSQILLLENIRFYPQEKTQDMEFAKQLASLGEVYVNDAFGVCHRSDTSITVIPKLLPSYGGLLLKKEIKSISQIINDPKKPFVAILGGSKISTKLHLLDKLIGLADYLLLGGGLANTLLAAQEHEVGTSLYEASEKQHSLNLINLGVEKNTKLIFPVDVVTEKNEVKNINEVSSEDKIVDIGPKTQLEFTDIIEQANTIVWNGPMGYFEDQRFKKGTDAICKAIVNNNHTTSIVGGGETITALENQENIEKITHISTGGGAMLEFIEKGTLPGIEALKR